MSSLAIMSLSSVHELVELTLFQVENNLLTGRIPREVGMAKKKIMYLFINNFASFLPPQFGELARL